MLHVMLCIFYNTEKRWIMTTVGEGRQRNENPNKLLVEVWVDESSFVKSLPLLLRNSISKNITKGKVHTKLVHKCA
jgi:hypothetical protein